MILKVCTWKKNVFRNTKWCQVLWTLAISNSILNILLTSLGYYIFTILPLYFLSLSLSLSLCQLNSIVPCKFDVIYTILLTHFIFCNIYVLFSLSPLGITSKIFNSTILQRFSQNQWRCYQVLDNSNTALCSTRMRPQQSRWCSSRLRMLQVCTLCR